MGNHVRLALVMSGTLAVASWAHAQQQQPLAPLPQQGTLPGFSPLASHALQPSIPTGRQQQRVPQPGVTPRVSPPAQSPLQLTNHTQYALNFYGGKAARATLEAMPRRQQMVTHAFVPNAPSKPKTKPFEGVGNGETVSPYLNLFRNEDDTEAAPNYFAFVRPQLQQQQANQRQRQQLQQINRQLQRVRAATNGTGYQRGGIPATGHNTFFLNTGQYYQTSSKE